MNTNKRIKKLRHVGYFVDDLNGTMGMLARLFDIDDGEMRRMSAEETAGAGEFGFVNVGDTELELIQLMSDEVKRMCGNPSAGISHIAFEVEGIEALVEELGTRGFRLGYITKHGIFDNGKTKVAYLAPEDTDGHLIELVEPYSEESSGEEP